MKPISFWFSFDTSQLLCPLKSLDGFGCAEHVCVWWMIFDSCSFYDIEVENQMQIIVILDAKHLN
jgi:hypothetical protein